MSWAKRVVAMLTVILGACSRDRSASTENGTPKKAEVAVITNAEEIEAARRTFLAHQDQRFKELLANPGSIYSFEREDIDILRSRLDEALTTLTALRDDPQSAGETQIQAAAALQLLGVQVSPSALAEIASKDDSAKRELLRRMNDLVRPDAKLPAVYREIVVSGINNVDPLASRVAVGLARQYEIHEAVPELTSRLAMVSGHDRDAVLGAIAALNPTRSVVDSLIVQLKIGDATPFGLSAPIDRLAEAAVKTDDDEARQVAVGAIVEFLSAQPDKPWFDSTTISAIGYLAKLPAQIATESLSTLARDAKWKGVQKTALSDLKKLDATLARQIAAEKGIKLDAAESTSVHSAEDSLSAKQVADICVQNGVLLQSEADLVLAKLIDKPSASEEEFAATDSVSRFLYQANRYFAFDTETGMLPNRHDLLIADLASKSAGQFRPEAVFENFTPDTPDSVTGAYSVQFIHDGRLYRFAPTDLGDWYDVGAVLTAIHRALEDARRSERFNLLASEDQVATVVFANPVALRRAAAKLDLDLSDDPDEARRQGVEFEDQVLQSVSDEAK